MAENKEKILVVDEEKILHDYKEIKANQNQKLEEIEQSAAIYANNRGYSAEKTADFIEFAKAAENYGLSAEDNAKLDILSGYVSEKEVADEVDDEAATEAYNGEIVGQY